MKSQLPGLLAFAVLVPTASAQITAVNNTCSSAFSGGDGSYSFDTFNSSPSGVMANGLPPYVSFSQPNTACEDFNNGGAGNLWNDVWMNWTASSSGTYLISTCSSAIFDTKLAVYNGSCGNPNALACNEDGDNCSGFTSELFVAGIQAGQTYRVQIGGFDNLETGSGTLSIGPAVPSANCSPNQDDSFENNDTCGNPTPLASGTYNNLWVSRTDQDMYAVDVAPGATLSVDCFHTAADGDIDTYIFSPNACGDINVFLAQGFTSSDNESMTWVNNTGQQQTYIIQVNIWAASTGPDCNDYDLVITGSMGNPSLGTNFCVSAINSTGQGSSISATGSVSVSANNLTLHANNVPASQPGIFFYGLVEVQLPFGDGFRCIGQAGPASIKRLFPFAQSDPFTNVLSYTVNNQSLPTGGDFFPGQTRKFQSWFRDPAMMQSGFNFSDGLSLNFVP